MFCGRGFLSNNLIWKGKKWRFVVIWIHWNWVLSRLPWSTACSSPSIQLFTKVLWPFGCFLGFGSWSIPLLWFIMWVDSWFGDRWYPSLKSHRLGSPPINRVDLCGIFLKHLLAFDFRIWCGIREFLQGHWFLVIWCEASRTLCLFYPLFTLYFSERVLRGFFVVLILLSCHAVWDFLSLVAWCLCCLYAPWDCFVPSHA